MEERERVGDNVGHEGPSCLQVDSRKRLCTIQPLRTNCYKLWLEVPSHLGPIRSKPVYLTPNDHGERWNQHLRLLLRVWTSWNAGLCLLTCFVFFFGFVNIHSWAGISMLSIVANSTNSLIGHKTKLSCVLHLLQWSHTHPRMWRPWAGAVASWGSHGSLLIYP